MSTKQNVNIQETCMLSNTYTKMFMHTISSFQVRTFLVVSVVDVDNDERLIRMN